MKSVSGVTRRTVPLTFSREFEALLLTYAESQGELSQDLEQAAGEGLSLLAELEDAQDLKHADSLQQLIETTTHYLAMTSPYFKVWYLDIAEDLLDEIELMLLTHGEDLKELGLPNTGFGTVLVLLCVAARTNFSL